MAYDPVRAGAFQVIEGRTPVRAGEVAVSQAVARRGIEVGDRLEVTQDDVPLTVVGVLSVDAQGQMSFLVRSPASSALIEHSTSEFFAAVPGGGRFKDEASNMMCTQPPWGQLTAIDVNTGEFAWRVPLGVTDSLPPDKQNTGRPGNGGTIATAGGLVFVGATDDARFRGFDAKTGKELWTYKLGGAAFATPSTYLGKDGRQYVVITSTGGGLVGGAPTSDDSIMSFALPAEK